jgi:adenylyltransferase/sulfurtransferase
MGVYAPLVGIIGSMQACEALKVLLGKASLCGKLMVLDALSMETRTLKLSRDSSCPACQNR